MVCLDTTSCWFSKCVDKTSWKIHHECLENMNMIVVTTLLKINLMSWWYVLIVSRLRLDGVSWYHGFLSVLTNRLAKHSVSTNCFVTNTRVSWTHVLMTVLMYYLIPWWTSWHERVDNRLAYTSWEYNFNTVIKTCLQLAVQDDLFNTVIKTIFILKHTTKCVGVLKGCVDGCVERF